MTNYNFCGAETTIDYAYHSPELKVTLEVFDHSSFPLNTSSHIPILYTPEYNKEIHNENFTEWKNHITHHIILWVEMFYLNTIEQLFLFVEQLDQLEVCLLIVDF